MQLMMELPAVISKEAKQIFYINSEQKQKMVLDHC